MDIFRHFLPLQEVYKDHSVILAHMLGGGLIGVTFLVIGLVFIFKTGKYAQGNKALKERKSMGKMVGWSLVICALSRFFDVICIWQNLAIISAILKDITGILGVITIGFIPYILKLIRTQVTIQEVKKSMTETTEKIEEIKKINETLK